MLNVVKHLASSTRFFALLKMIYPSADSYIQDFAGLFPCGSGSSSLFFALPQTRETSDFSVLW